MLPFYSRNIIFSFTNESPPKTSKLKSLKIHGCSKKHLLLKLVKVFSKSIRMEWEKKKVSPKSQCNFLKRCENLNFVSLCKRFFLIPLLLIFFSKTGVCCCRISIVITGHYYKSAQTHSFGSIYTTCCNIYVWRFAISKIALISLISMKIVRITWKQHTTVLRSRGKGHLEYLNKVKHLKKKKSYKLF